MPTTVLLFYKYTSLNGQGQAVVDWQKELGEKLNLQGRILVADEGMNGCIAAPADTIQAYCKAVEDSKFFGPAHKEEPIDWKTSVTDEDVLFPGFSVKLVASICGGGEIAKAPLELGGKHLTPDEWHNTVKDLEGNNAILLDCRNDYEYAIGRFKGATDPGTKHFHEFADYVDKHKDQWKEDGKKVLMYCTGGIRCEKASVSCAYVAQCVSNENPQPIVCVVCKRGSTPHNAVCPYDSRPTSEHRGSTTSTNSRVASTVI